MADVDHQIVRSKNDGGLCVANLAVTAYTIQRIIKLKFKS